VRWTTPFEARWFGRSIDNQDFGFDYSAEQIITGCTASAVGRVGRASRKAVGADVAA
jgi:hypothetical protein